MEAVVIPTDKKGQKRTLGQARDMTLLVLLVCQIRHFGDNCVIKDESRRGTLLTRLSFCDRRLRCPRNSLHLHLFVSFMIRSAVYLLKSAFFSFSSSEMLFSSAMDDALNITSTSSNVINKTGEISVVWESKVSCSDIVSYEAHRTLTFDPGDGSTCFHLCMPY